MHTRLVDEVSYEIIERSGEYSFISAVEILASLYPTHVLVIKLILALETSP